ncbi:unnamed protein product [Paramecium sonneborni]|uniref:Uncharacterized protein n=1 Tax=Paramecium sonneborni TaxID=65129 RepID=A0A8S1P0L5_9CILI|nr:unnamed protein product [Paramecium sonneborni]
MTGVMQVNLCITSSRFKILFSSSNNLSLLFCYNCCMSNLLTTDHIYLKARSKISNVTYQSGQIVLSYSINNDPSEE